MANYDTVVGLEVHIQMNTKSKAFCGDANSFGDEPNTNVSAVSLAHPGTLPVANAAHVHKAVQLGLALGCEINQLCFFDRKHYFYPDLPKGYQITQDNEPICLGGSLEIPTASGPKKVEIHHIHMEEDAGKNIHDIDPKYSLLDVNRAGTPLLELVTEPCLSSGEEVFSFMAELQKLLRYIDVSDADMEKGSMRCDCNVSVKLRGTTKLGERCEIKNLNSKRFARLAVEYEAKRQIQMLEEGITFSKQTLHFDVDRLVTQVLREKEGVADYRYFPDPDLVPVRITDAELEELTLAMPAMPWEEKHRLMNEHSLTEEHVDKIIEDRSHIELFDELVGEIGDSRLIANFLLNQYLPTDRAIRARLHTFTILSYLDLLLTDQVAASTAAQRLWPAIISNPDCDVLDEAKRLNVLIKRDEDIAARIIREVLAAEPEKVEQYRKGKKALFGYFM
ncbi:MAG: Asp-tRNA(Asn)/Glu-tRNA(Gln) amidotransferase subunit GatB, partial [Bacteroidota bacterium]